MLYLGRFSFDQHEAAGEDHVGTFEVMMEADSPEQAGDGFRLYLADFAQRKPNELFRGRTVIYLDDVFQVKVPLEKPVLINYASQQQTEETATLHCPMPDDSAAVEAFAWGTPEDHEELEVFLTLDSDEELGSS
jgi:hypothetical protein